MDRDREESDDQGVTRERIRQLARRALEQLRATPETQLLEEYLAANATYE